MGGRLLSRIRSMVLQFEGATKGLNVADTSAPSMNLAYMLNFVCRDFLTFKKIVYEAYRAILEPQDIPGIYNANY